MGWSMRGQGQYGVVNEGAGRGRARLQGLCPTILYHLLPSRTSPVLSCYPMPLLSHAILCLPSPVLSF